jgi:hypothetical protein
MAKIYTLKEVSEKYNVSTYRLKTIFNKINAPLRTLSNTEIRDLQWKGYDKRSLKGVFIEEAFLEMPSFKLELSKCKSQYEANELFGQGRFCFE